SLRASQHVRVGMQLLFIHSNILLGLPYVINLLTPPQIYPAEKTFLIHHHTHDYGKPPVLALKGFVDKPVTYTGDKLAVDITCDNNSGRAVHSIKCKLKQ